MNIDEIKEILIRDKLVNKKFKIKSTDQFISSQFYKDFIKHNYPIMPPKIFVDIIFTFDGEFPFCSYCNEELDYNDLSNFKPINYMHRKCAFENRTDNADYTTSIHKRHATCLAKYRQEECRF